MSHSYQATRVSSLNNLLLEFYRGNGWLQTHAMTVLVHKLNVIYLIPYSILDVGLHVGLSFQFRPSSYLSFGLVRHMYVKPRSTLENYQWGV